MSQAASSEKFERLLNRHKDSVYRQMLRVCGNHEDTEDALVEAILAAYKQYQSLNDEEHFRAWLAVIGRRICVRIRRKNALIPVTELADDIPEHVEESDFKNHPVINKIKDALHLLTPEERAAFELRDLNQISGDQAAKQLGITLPALKSRLHRARAKIRNALDNCLDCHAD
jgi:RNA polymerase sigma-70 factor (ECF subfamily)